MCGFLDHDMVIFCLLVNDIDFFSDVRCTLRLNHSVFQNVFDKQRLGHPGWTGWSVVGEHGTHSYLTTLVAWEFFYAVCAQS